LVGLLWPDKEESKARHSLNEALRVIRRVVGEALRTEGDNIQLAPGAISVDLDNLQAVLSPGVFLDGFTVPDAPAFEDWMIAEREGLRVRILDQLLGKAERNLADGKLTSGRESAEKALEIEPLHEPAVQILMRAHALEGGRVLALRTYERFRDQIERDLELEPSRATAELAERIRHERLVPGARVSEAAADDVIPVVGCGHTVLADCVDVWRQSQTGSPAMIVLRGDPGTGKTRITDELAARARLDGAVVAFARALDGECADGIWAAMLKGGLDVPELAGAAPQVLAALGAIEPDLFAKFPAASASQPISDAGEPFSQAVAAVAEAKPVLLILDDAFKAEQPALEALGSIVQRAGEARICVLLTVLSVPSVPVDSLCQRLGRDIPGELLVTGSFLESDIAELVAWAFPEYDEQASDRLTRRVLADTAGNPFLAVELIRAIRAGMHIGVDTQGGAWPAEARTLDQTIPGDLPQSVAASLRVRFRGLAEHGQELLAVVAVLGGNEPTEILARVGGMSTPEAEHALDELEWQRWLVADARGYTFVTGLAKEVVLADMITRGKKRRILERAGRS
jgi:DNA-binding SARP family transcriptional activator